MQTDRKKDNRQTERYRQIDTHRLIHTDRKITDRHPQKMDEGTDKHIDSHREKAIGTDMLDRHL